MVNGRSRSNSSLSIHQVQIPDITRNKKAILTDIDNPLIRLSPSELEAAVDEFVRDHELEDIKDLLLRGAKVTRDPEAYGLVPGLTDMEKSALEREKKMGFWRQTKELRTTIFTCAIAAILQGCDQASMNGANLQWPDATGLHVWDNSNKRDLWIFAFVNASPYLFAAIVGAWLCDPLNEFVYGRRAAIFVSAIFCFVSVIGSAFAHTWQQLLACRILLGIGMGAKASVVPVYAAEISPAHIRGSLVMNWQVFVAFGIFLGFSANLAMFDVSSIAWRLQLAAACLPAIPLLCLIFVCPESPRFLLKKGDLRKAYKSLLYLNETPLQAARELFYIHAQIEAEKRVHANISSKTRDLELQPSTTNTASAYKDDSRKRYLSGGFWARLWLLGSVPRMRRAVIAAVVVMISQQLCGVNVITFYSSTVFTSGDATNLSGQRSALWLGWGFGLTNFLFAFPAYRQIDRRGRRALLLLTIPGLSLLLLGAAFAFKISTSSKAHNAVISLFIILFEMVYSPGLGPVPFTYSAEVFPLVNREVGMSFAVFWNLLGAGILSLVVPFITLRLHPTGLLCLFAGLNMIGFVLIFLFVYETKQATLEELNSIFSVKTKRHIQYQFYQVLPWLWRYYISRTETSKLDPPYRWNRGRA